MLQGVAHKLIETHRIEGNPMPGEEIGLRIDQTLTQDAMGTMVMLELEAMELDRVKTELSAQYVDHNLLAEDFKNPDDHLFLQSACQRLGVWYSRPGNGVSHPLHQERFGAPGKTLLGSDSHTCAAGAIGMLAMGAGGIEVAMAMAGEPFFVKMPEIWGVELTVSLSDFGEVDLGARLEFSNLAQQLAAGGVSLVLSKSSKVIKTCHTLSSRQLDVVLVGGVINRVRSEREATS